MIFKKLLSLLVKPKHPVIEPELTDEQKYWRWKSTQDVAEIGVENPKFDKTGKRIHDQK